MARKWWILSAVACGTFMATLDASIVNVALPTLNREFQVPIGLSKWVIVAYFSIITCLLLPFGQWSDRLGRRTVFLLGFATFTLSSLICAVAPTLGGLVAGRITQGLGSAMLMANGPAVITQAFIHRDRGFALGILAMVVSVGLIAGPAIGGPVIHSVGWRSIFLMNIPFGILGAILVFRFFPTDEKRSSHPTFDWRGAILQTAIILGIIEISNLRNGLSPGLRFLAFLFICSLIAVFVRLETRTAHPLFDMSLLKHRVFWTGNISSFIIFFSYSSVSVLFPFFLEDVLKYSVHRTGVFLSLIPVTILIVAPWAGRQSDRMGSLVLCTVGSALMSITLLILSSVAFSPAAIFLSLMGFGMAMGLFQSPNNNAIMGCVPRNKLGSASAFLATVRNLGLVTGAHFSTGFFSWKMAQSQSYTQSLQSTWWISGLIATGAVLGSLGKRTQQTTRLKEL